MDVVTAPADAAVDLSRTECLSLLASVPIGRVVFTQRALPAILPMSFLLDCGHVVLRTGEGTVLLAARTRSVMAFEADAYDAAGGSGWSVTVTGRAIEVTDGVELDRLRELPLAPYARGSRDHYVLIPVELVDGRRVGAAPGPPRAPEAAHPTPVPPPDRTPMTDTTDQDPR